METLFEVQLGTLTRAKTLGALEETEQSFKGITWPFLIAADVEFSSSTSNKIAQTTS